MPTFERYIIPILVIVYITRMLMDLIQRSQGQRKLPEREREKGESFFATPEEIEEYLQVGNPPELFSPLEELAGPPESRPIIRPAVSAKEEPDEISLPENLSEIEEEVPETEPPLLSEILFPLSTDKLKQGILLSAILGPPRAVKLFR
jgi:hypothetical protein